MGIHQDWWKEIKRENGEFNDFVLRDGYSPRSATTFFIDGQIRLMRSYMSDDYSWETFIDNNFFKYVEKAHDKYENVIISFDNYNAVPAYKSIEQTRRTAQNKSGNKFGFDMEDTLPKRPPMKSVWNLALENRIFKTKLITSICKAFVNNYKCRNKARNCILYIDFVSVIKMEFDCATGVFRRETLENMQEMGESDVKFMRYIPLLGDIVVDSIDSDVLLISMLYLQKKNFQHNIFVRRYKVTIEDDTIKTQKRKLSGKTKKEYEVVDIKKMSFSLFNCVRHAVGPELIIPDEQLTNIIVLIFLLCGSDFTPKLPRIGPKTVWEQLHIIVPLMILCIYQDEDGGLCVEEEKFVDLVFSNMYRNVFRRHVKNDEDEFTSVMKDLQNSTLSEKTKNDIPNKDKLISVITSVQWVMTYWNCHNTSPPISEDGKHGFQKIDGLWTFSHV